MISITNVLFKEPCGRENGARNYVDGNRKTARCDRSAIRDLASAAAEGRPICHAGTKRNSAVSLAPRGRKGRGKSHNPGTAGYPAGLQELRRISRAIS